MVGHSLGATITLYLAASRNPPDAAVLMAPSVTVGAGNRLLLGAYRLTGRTRIPWRRIGTGRPPGVPADSPDAQGMPITALRTNLALKAETAALLPAVRCPVTVLAGAEDRLVRARELERITAGLPDRDTPVHVLPRSAHALPVAADRDEAFRITVDFLAGHSHHPATAPTRH